MLKRVHAIGGAGPGSALSRAGRVGDAEASVDAGAALTIPVPR